MDSTVGANIINLSNKWHDWKFRSRSKNNFNLRGSGAGWSIILQHSSASLLRWTLSNLWLFWKGVIQWKDDKLSASAIHRDCTQTQSSLHKYKIDSWCQISICNWRQARTDRQDELTLGWRRNFQNTNFETDIAWTPVVVSNYDDFTMWISSSVSIVLGQSSA